MRERVSQTSKDGEIEADRCREIDRDIHRQKDKKKDVEKDDYEEEGEKDEEQEVDDDSDDDDEKEKTMKKYVDTRLSLKCISFPLKFIRDWCLG